MDESKTEKSMHFLSVEMHLNFKNQMLLVYKQDKENTSKMTFNEISMAESHPLGLSSTDY